MFSDEHLFVRIRKHNRRNRIKNYRHFLDVMLEKKSEITTNGLLTQVFLCILNNTDFGKVHMWDFHEVQRTNSLTWVGFILKFF